MPPIWTSIELTETEAVVVQARGGKGQPALRRAVRIPLPAETGEPGAPRAQVRGQALAEGLKQAGIKTASAVVVAPKRFVTVRYAVLPSTDEAELKQMARFEAERHVPFNTDRHVYAYHVMRKEGISGSRVLLAAADGPDIEEIVGIAAAARFQIEAIDVSSLAQFNALALSAPPSFAQETAALLHLGSQTIDISIVSEGLLIFTRSVPHGYERLASALREVAPVGVSLSIQELHKIDLLHPAEGLRSLGFSPDELQERAGSGELQERAASGELQERPAADSDTQAVQTAMQTPALARVREWILRLVTEVQRSYEFASRELECPPVSALYLCGEAVKWPNFDAYLQANLSVELRRVQPFEAMEIEKTLDAAARADEGPYAAAVGALARHWRPGALGIDLLPEPYRARQASVHKRRSVLTMALLTVAVLSLGAVYYHERLSLQEQVVQGLRKATRELAPRVEGLVDKEKQLGIINTYRLDKRSALVILDTISGYAYIPRKVALTYFEFTKGNTVKLSGYASSLEDLNRFVNDLEKAVYQDEKIFPGGVVPDKQEFNKTLDKSRPQPLVAFTLTCHLRD